MKPKWKRMHDRLWELVRRVMLKRSDNRCEICGKTSVLQVDHCFSRTNREIFYNIANLTVLCSACHFNKSHRQRAMDAVVFDHVRQREGDGEYRILKWKAHSRSSFPDWKNMLWIESQMKRWEGYEKQLAENGRIDEY